MSVPKIGPDQLENCPASDSARTVAEVTQDEREVLVAYRRAKSFGFADLMISIQEGTRVKLWLTEKRR